MYRQRPAIILILSLLAMLSSHLAEAGSCLKRGARLIEQGEYDEAVACLTDGLSSTRTDREATEVAVLLDTALWAQAEREGTSQAYRSYINKSRTPRHMHLALNRACRAEVQQVYQAAVRRQEVELLLRYSDAHPECRMSDELTRRAGELAFKLAADEATTASWQRFLSAWPEHSLSAEAEERLDQLEFAQAIEHPGTDALLAYLEAYPDGLHRSEAQTEVDKRLWQAVLERDDRQAVEEYLSKMPEGAHVEEARARLAMRYGLLWVEGNTLHLGSPRGESRWAVEMGGDKLLLVGTRYVFLWGTRGLRRVSVTTGAVSIIDDGRVIAAKSSKDALFYVVELDENVLYSLKLVEPGQGSGPEDLVSAAKPELISVARDAPLALTRIDGELLTMNATGLSGRFGTGSMGASTGVLSPSGDAAMLLYSKTSGRPYTNEFSASTTFAVVPITLSGPPPRVEMRTPRTDRGRMLKGLSEAIWSDDSGPMISITECPGCDGWTGQPFHYQLDVDTGVWDQVSYVRYDLAQAQGVWSDLIRIEDETFSLKTSRGHAFLYRAGQGEALVDMGSYPRYPDWDRAPLELDALWMTSQQRHAVIRLTILSYTGDGYDQSRIYFVSDQASVQLCDGCVFMPVGLYDARALSPDGEYRILDSRHILSIETVELLPCKGRAIAWIH